MAAFVDRQLRGNTMRNFQLKPNKEHQFWIDSRERKLRRFFRDIVLSDSGKRHTYFGTMNLGAQTIYTAPKRVSLFRTMKRGTQSMDVDRKMVHRFETVNGGVQTIHIHQPNERFTTVSNGESRHVEEQPAASRKIHRFER